MVQQLRQVTRAQPTGELRCSWCDRRFGNRTALNAHEDAHAREERDPCPPVPVEVECERCGGDGGWSVPINIDRRDGSLIERWDECETCGGTGSYEVEPEPATEEGRRHGMRGMVMSNLTTTIADAGIYDGVPDALYHCGGYLHHGACPDIHCPESEATDEELGWDGEPINLHGEDDDNA